MDRITRGTIRKHLNDEKSISLIKKELDSNPDHTVSSLTKYACEHFSFINFRGELRISSCKVSIQNLISSGKIVLPKSRAPRKIKFTQMVRLNEVLPLPENLPGSVREMKPGIEIMLISTDDSYSKKVWNELMATEHPLGETRIMGYQIKYLISYEGDYIGACSFSSCALRLEARDTWINWSEDEREQYQSRVLNMSRFLIRNGVKCKNLASYLLARLVKRFKIDFKERYAISPWIVETFIDTQKYVGTCYKAANWQYLGQTKGRGRDDRYSKKNKSIKDIYVYVLEPKFRLLAGLSEPGTVHYIPMDVEVGLDNSTWAQQEFGAIELGDERLSKRLVNIATAKGASPDSSYPQAVAGDSLKMKAYYHFLSNNNEQISFEQILSQHRHSTIRRIKSSKTAIAIQDTCDLNYSGLKQTTGLGKIGKNKNSDGTLGLSLHSTFMVDENGLPLGIAHGECTAPSVDGKHAKGRNQLPIQEKESYRWIRHYEQTIAIAANCPDTRIISAMDREADIFELLELACKNRTNAPIVIRAQHNRILENKKLKLFDYLQTLPVSGTTTVNVPPQRAKAKTSKNPARPYLPERKADLQLIYKKITIPAKKTPTASKTNPLSLYAVSAREVNPPEGAEAISWTLLTTLEIKSPEDALACVQIYKLRWRIEEFHRVLKSGCGIEKYKQRHVEKLKRVIAMDMVIAWRIMLLTLLGRDCPDLPADVIFNEHELLVLNLLAEKKTSWHNNNT